jgi:flagellar hook-basal body complex protein FliE
MPVGPIDPSMATMGAEWKVPGVSGDIPDVPGAAGGAGGADVPGASFGDMLTNQVQNLQGLQNEAATQSQALATGQAADPSQVVMAVERARLGMQLASQIRTKLVEAQQDIFHTQV